MKSLVWFRRDLRTEDNPALYEACQNSADGVIGIFVMSAKQWREHDESNRKVHFWMRNLESLSQKLAAINVPLLIAECDTIDEIPDLLVKSAEQHGCQQLYLNREYEVNEKDRDAQVAWACKQADISIHAYHDRVIIPPAGIQTKDGRFYSVFTPYRKVWDAALSDVSGPLPSPGQQRSLKLKASKIPAEVAGFDFSDARSDLWPAGEDEAQRRLRQFSERIGNYDGDRDIPSINGTSTLSPYLAAGVISARKCLDAARSLDDGKQSLQRGITTWISELTWRDFYTHVLVGFPRVSKHLPFKLSTKKVRWRSDEEEFTAWKEGRTGYPIVDAGMRQLNQTGWMHNRVRMVTAMFLTKHLLIDWRWGERYFMQQLVDGDLAANNGGWQWSASTGTDAAPYFRIFNPFSQSQRFDREGEYIKKFCPELETLPSNVLHDAKRFARALEEHAIDYPTFIVEHKTGRERALAEFKRAS